MTAHALINAIAFACFAFIFSGVPVGDSASPPALVGYTAYADANSTSATPDLGALSAGTIAINHIVIAHVHLVSGGDGAFASAPSGEGWTRIVDVENTAGANSATSVFWKRWGAAGQTDDTTPTFTAAGGSLAAVCSVWRGCKTTGNPYDGSEFASTSGTTGTSLSGANVTVTAGNAKTMICMYGAATAAGNVSSLSGTFYTSAYFGASFAATAGTDRAVGMNYNPNVPSGSVPGSTATLSVSATVWSEVSLVLTG